MRPENVSSAGLAWSRAWPDPGHHQQISGLNGGHTARDRCVDQRSAGARHVGVKVLQRRWIDRAGIGDDGPGCQSGHQSLGSQVGGADRRVVGERHDHHVRVQRRLARCRRDADPETFAQLLSLRRRAVVDNDGMACVDQAPHHGRTHPTGADHGHRRKLAHVSSHPLST